MSDDDALDSVDTEDTEEHIYNPRNLKGLRNLRSHTSSNQDLDQNNSFLRRSQRNKSQTYDNLNTSWIFGKCFIFCQELNNDNLFRPLHKYHLLL